MTEDTEKRIEEIAANLDKSPYITVPRVEADWMLGQLRAARRKEPAMTDPRIIVLIAKARRLADLAKLAADYPWKLPQGIDTERVLHDCAYAFREATTALAAKPTPEDYVRAGLEAAIKEWNANVWRDKADIISDIRALDPAVIARAVEEGKR